LLFEPNNLEVRAMTLLEADPNQVKLRFSTVQSKGLNLNPGDSFTVTFSVKTATPDRGRGPFGGKQYPGSAVGVTIGAGSRTFASPGEHGVLVMSQRSQWGMMRSPYKSGTARQGVMVELLAVTLTYERGTLSDDSLVLPPKVGIVPASQTKHSGSKADFIAMGKLEDGKSWDLSGEIVSLEIQP
jgi:hypothetical protein